MALLGAKGVQLQQRTRVNAAKVTLPRLVSRPVSSVVVKASAEPTTPAAAPAPVAPPSTRPPQQYVEASDFSISKVSFGSILTPVGVGLLTYGFGAFFQLLPGADISSLMLIYGFPISVLGFALSYAQLEPVKCKSTQAALNLRESKATDIQKQIREDTTRFRYGDEQHLEEALDKIFKFNRQGGVPRKLAPKLTGLREEVIDGAYTLILEFESKLEAEKWVLFQPKIQSFFGPGIIAKLESTSQGMDVLLICDGSGAGRGGGERPEVLPPLMPGLKPRQQQ